MIKPYEMCRTPQKYDYRPLPSSEWSGLGQHCDMPIRGQALGSWTLGALPPCWPPARPNNVAVNAYKETVRVHTREKHLPEEKV